MFSFANVYEPSDAVVVVPSDVPEPLNSVTVRPPADGSTGSSFVPLPFASMNAVPEIGANVL